MADKETLGFQAEVKQLLHLMIHSLYSNKEIFLRELISNASDAADKLRYEALAQPSHLADDPDLKIHLSFDKDARTLTIADNGIGMSRVEVVTHIGTIAKSGTREFFQNLSGDDKKDANLIGQFGVGFYSAFIVADKVTLTTRRAGRGADEAVRWESAGDGEYTIEQVSKPTRGTEIVLHLREGEDEFLNEWRLSGIVKKYSDHISIPIVLHKPKLDDEGKPTGEEETEAINQASALWTRPKSEITDEQYKAFYKHVSHDWEDPLAWAHAKVEGTKEYTQLLYIPARAPFDLYDRDHRHGLKLYVKRVFIMDEADKLLPGYLRFVKGLVDSADLPLNVSRELLQGNRDVDNLRAANTKKVLGLLEELASSEDDAEKEKFTTFWKEFGTVFKEGVGEDLANREKVAKLCRFASTQLDTPEQVVSLDDYIGRMKEGQDTIYFVTADTFAAAQHSPHLEIFRKKGVEVLLLTDRVDEWVVSSLHEYAGKKLQSVAKGALDLGDLEDEAEKEAQKQAETELKDVLVKVQDTLGERVQEVRVTHRLTDSPACLVVSDNEMSAHLERLLKSAGQKTPSVKPILELNPEHALVKKLAGGGERFDDLATVLFEQALLAEGGQLEDPAGFVKRVNQLFLGGV